MGIRAEIDARFWGWLEKAARQGLWGMQEMPVGVDFARESDDESYSA